MPRDVSPPVFRRARHGVRGTPGAVVVLAAVGLFAGCENISDDEYAARLAQDGTSGITDTANPGTTDDCPGGEATWYLDSDSDGYGDPTAAVQACEQPDGAVANFDDCDDTDPEAAIPGQWFLDADSDGYGGDSLTTACQAPLGYVAVTGDCDDTAAAAYPGAAEVCDGLDNDCNALVDDEDPNADLTTVPVAYRDADGDGVGDDNVTVAACEVPDGYVLVGGDCDDTEPLASPALDEVCDDGIDNDCDGTANDCGLPSTVDLASSADAELFTNQAFVSHGERVVALGDVSADGLPDLAVSVPGEGEGTVYVLDGLAGLAGAIETESTARARLSGPAGDGRFGYQIADLGDVNGDGLSDLLIGDPFDDTVDADAGAAWLLAGPISGDVDIAASAVPLWGESADAKAGWSLGSAGDWNGDGAVDLLVGAYADEAGGIQAGAAYVVNGPVTAGASLADADLVVRGAFQDRLGFSVGGDLDLNGDGIADIVVGADRADPDGVFNAGRAVVFYGPLTGEAVQADADASIVGTTASAYVGVLVAGGGDLDGDGLGDLMVGATGENGGGTSGAGALFVFSGPVSGDVDTSAATARIDGAVAGDSVGGAATVVPDMTLDGRSELLVGARGVDQGSGGRDGGGYLWYGPLSGAASLTDADVALRGSDGEQAGAAVTAADFNADGVGDLVVGAPSGNRAWMVIGGGL